MILYSITFNVENSVHEAWYKWLKAAQIPSMLLSGLVSDYKILRMLDEHDNGGTTYSCQFYMNDMTAVSEFETLYEPKFIEEVDKDYKSQYVMFKTLLEVLV
ncbi:MAG: hypothetical protein RL308_2957 [Bacteroidota bacterium]|jgi:hypothetical protein